MGDSEDPAGIILAERWENGVLIRFVKISIGFKATPQS